MSSRATQSANSRDLFTESAFGRSGDVRSIVLPTYSSQAANDRKPWVDLRICLQAIDSYAIDFVDEVVIAWDGPHAPDGVPQGPKYRYLHRPEGLDSAQAMGWGIEQSQAEEIFHMQDDAVLHPDAIRFMLEDLDILAQNRPDLLIGLLGARSNYVAGHQNVRSANGGKWDYGTITYDTEWQILQTDIVFPVLAWYTRSAFEQVGGFAKGIIWSNDVLFNYDLSNAGYTHFISRAYVHHVGSRATTESSNIPQLEAESIAWMKANRPDFLQYMVERGFHPPSVLTGG